MMSTLKANNYLQAKKELEAFNPTLVEKLSEDIDAENAKLYNVILCSKTHIPSQKTYKDSFFIQYFHLIGFNKLKKYRGDSFDKIIVLHDPTKKDNAPAPPAEPPVAPAANTPANTPEENK